MKRSNGWLILGFLMVAGTAAPALARDDEKVEIKDLPKPVLAAAQKAFSTGKVVSASQEKDDGEMTYEVKMTVDGKTVEVVTDDEGNIEAIEREIAVEDLPKAVTRAAAKLFPGGKITEVAEVTASKNFVLYELAIKTDTKDPVDVIMAPNGKVVPADNDDDDAKKDKDDDDKKDKKDNKDKKDKKDKKDMKEEDKSKKSSKKGK